MSFQHGAGTRVLLEEFDISTYLSGATTGRTRDNTEVTTFQPGVANPVRSFMATLAGGTLSLEGLWDPETGALDPVVASALDGTLDVVTVSVQGATAIGQRATLLSGLATDAPIGAAVGEAVSLSVSKMGSAAVRGGVILKEHDAETSIGNFASVDNGASSLFGGVGHLHVVSFTGTDATIKITDSANDSTFADLISFTQVTAVGAERLSAAGTVDRYARVELTGTFTSITFSVGFARLNQ